jgi:hypothetical protein
VFLPRDAQGFFTAVIGLQVNLIMLTNAMLFFLSKADTFPYFVWAFFGAGALQAFVQSVESGFSKRLAKRSAMACSFCSRPGEWQ